MGSLSVGVIIGCAVGGAVVLAILLIVTAVTVVFMVKRWKKKGNHKICVVHRVWSQSLSIHYINELWCCRINVCVEVGIMIMTVAALCMIVKLL